MKVIFLDIDGVLNLEGIERDEYGSTFHQEFVNNLKRIVDATDAKIVISSSWRSDGFEKMESMWIGRNLPGEVVGITPFDDDRHRGAEIKMFMDKYDKHIDTYVILDDDTDMLEEQIDSFVRCSDNEDHNNHIHGYGITDEVANKAIKILNNE
jgi:hypothetical protein